MLAWSMVSRECTGLLSIAVLVAAVGACTGDGATHPAAASDTTVIPVADTVFARLPVTDSVRATVAAAGSELVVAAQLDSLRREISALAAAVGALQGGQTGRSSIDTASGGAAADEVGGLTPLQPAQRAIESAAEATHFGVRVLWAAVVLGITALLVKALVWVLDALSEKSATRRLFFKRLTPIIRLVVWSISIYIVIAGIFRVDRQGLIAAAAALGVAIGFASQDVLKNVFGGLLIVFDRPFQVGDKIRVGGTYGEVVSIGLRATRIVTPDDNLVSVPNMEVVQGQVANANAGALDCQVVVDLYLPGWIDVMKAKAIAYDAAANSRYVYLDKPIVVNVKDEFKETFLTHLMVKAYVIDTRYEFVFASDVTETAKAEFLKAGMLFPFVSPAARQFHDASGFSAPAHHSER